jgi:hypothetical protein
LYKKHFSFLCSQVDHVPPEECEAFFFLYNHEKSAQVSERFIMHIMAGTDVRARRGAKKGQPYDDKMSVLFTVSVLLRSC